MGAPLRMIPVEDLDQILHDAWIELPPERRRDGRVVIRGFLERRTRKGFFRYRCWVYLPGSELLEVEDPSGLRGMSVCTVLVDDVVTFEGCEDSLLRLSIPTSSVQLVVADHPFEIRRIWGWRPVARPADSDDLVEPG